MVSEAEAVEGLVFSTIGNHGQASRLATRKCRLDVNLPQNCNGEFEEDVRLVLVLKQAAFMPHTVSNKEKRIQN